MHPEHAEKYFRIMQLIKTQLNAMFENKSIGLLVKEMEAGQYFLM